MGEIIPPVYVYSYTWRRNGVGEIRHFETMLTRRHPLLELKEWQDKYDGNSNARLLWYHEITDHELFNPRQSTEDEAELQQHLHFTLDENMGELT